MVQGESVEKIFFDRLAEVEKGPKTRKTKLSAYIGTVGFVFRSKSKCLALRGISALYLLKLIFHPILKIAKKPQTVQNFILTVRGFIDTLTLHHVGAGLCFVIRIHPRADRQYRMSSCCW